MSQVNRQALKLMLHAVAWNLHVPLKPNDIDPILSDISSFTIIVLIISISWAINLSQKLFILDPSS